MIMSGSYPPKEDHIEQTVGVYTAEVQPTMAAAEAPKQELTSNHVQEFALNIDKLPERYIHRESDFGAVDVSCPLAEVPVIDYGQLLASSTPQGGDQELKKLHSALTIWGCFQVINHDIESSFLDKVREVAKEFYELPPEEKKKYSRAVDDLEGYGNDTVVSERQTFDWNDRLYFLVDPEDERKLQYWPKNPSDFRDTLHEFTMKTRVMKGNVLKALARSLNLEENYFLKQFGNRAITEARFNFYPPCPWPDKTLGVKPHSDATAITILLQDKQVAGLQVMKDDKWFQVPIIPHALFVNAGELMEIMSNGIFKSPVHRVVTNSEKERMTVAMFYVPEKEKEVGPAEELISNGRPRLFKNVKHNLQTYFKYYQHGLRSIDAARI